MGTTGRRCPAITGTAFARACGAMRRMGCIFGGKWQTIPTFYARKTARRDVRGARGAPLAFCRRGPKPRQTHMPMHV